MDSHTFQEDTPVFCLTSPNGRQGIDEAMTALKSLLPADGRRHFYGIFWPGRDGGTFKVAASRLDSDPEAEHLGTFIIQNGPYNSFYLTDYRSQPGLVEKTFEILRGQHEVDPEGYCLEWYVNEHDVKCLVPLGKHYRPFTGLNR